MAVGYNAPVTFINTVVNDNQVSHFGAGLAVDGSDVRFLHTTIARNSGGDGSGVHVVLTSTVNMTNTILFSHTVGITVAAGNTATLNATLWHANGSKTGGAWTINTTNNHDGDADGYHLTSNSAAIDQGVEAGVTADIDGEVPPI